MKKTKQIIVYVLVFALICAYTPNLTGQMQDVNAAVKVKKKAYTLTKKAGTYEDSVKVKLKVKKGYKVYYSTNGTFSKKMVVKSGKTKSFTFSTTKKLSLYAVKKSKTVSKAKLKKKSTKKKADKYLYKIVASDEDTSDDDEDAEEDESQTDVTATPVSVASSTPKASAGVEGDEEENPSESSQPSSEASAAPTIDPSATTASPAESPIGTPPEGTPPEGTPGVVPGETPGATSGAVSSSAPTAAQEEIDQSVSDANVTAAPITTQEPSVVEAATPVITLTQDDITSTNITDTSEVYESATEGNVSVLTIKAAGTYVLTGGTEDAPLKNMAIQVDAGSDEAVNLVWDNLVIDNSELGTVDGEDVPVIEIAKKTTLVNVTLIGNSKLIGNGSYCSETAPSIVYAKDSSAIITFMASAEDLDASLTLTDSIESTTDFGDNDPTDGICSKGTLVIQSGNYAVTSNGDCLKGTGADGAGGVSVVGGTVNLTSKLSNGLKTKNGCINISGGTINTLYTKEDGVNAKSYAVNITGGNLTIDNCYGDGIQGETVDISGDDTVIDITTYYENAGKNYYNSSLGTGNYNILTSSDTKKVEEVNVDTGSHKGIKAGTKACTYQYTTVEDGSDYVAGTTYTDEASGGLVISGGTITVDTTNTGIKYNGGGGSMGGGSSSSSGNLSAATSEGQYIIGAPDDTIHSNNTCVITGGDITLSSADDGITSSKSLVFSGACNVAVLCAYEGIESGTINMGSASGSDEAPIVSVYTNDDGLNASSKSSVSYVYADESEEVYTKTELSSSDNVFNMLGGYLNVTIADDVTHSFSLPVEGSANTSSTYRADGDGIDCNGSFYAYGGTVIVYGASSNDNAPIDCNNDYYIGNGVTLFACGSNGMVENPTSIAQPTVTFGSSSSSGAPGGRGGQSSSSSSVSISANTAFAVLDANSQVQIAAKASKTLSYVLYSSPSLTSGTTYTLSTGGSLSGNAVLPDVANDLRYTQYDTSGASASATAQASTK